MQVKAAEFKERALPGKPLTLSALSTLLAWQRRGRRVWRKLKPWVPLLFWAVLLLLARPFLLAPGRPAATLPREVGAVGDRGFDRSTWQPRGSRS